MIIYIYVLCKWRAENNESHLQYVILEKKAKLKASPRPKATRSQTPPRSEKMTEQSKMLIYAKTGPLSVSRLLVKGSQCRSPVLGRESPQLLSGKFTCCPVPAAFEEQRLIYEPAYRPDGKEVYFW